MSYTRPNYIYFVRPIGMDGPIKIGCSGVPVDRLRNLSVWSPWPLEIVATAEGDYALEQRLHRRFASLHLHREWFRAAPELTAAIEAISAGSAVSDAVDLSIITGTIRGRGKGGLVEPVYRKGLRSYTSRVRHTEKRLRALGEDSAWHAPDDVVAIISQWCGNPYRRLEGTRPSARQFRRLDEYLADPGAHSVVPSWRRERLVA